MSEQVIPFMFGNHLHWEGQPVCATCVAENAAWEGIVERNHTYDLAVKITKTKAYHAYRQAKPFDDYEAVLSLDLMLENGQTLPSDDEALIEAYARSEELENFKEVLTPKQLEVIDLLLAGQESREIADFEGYTSTGGVRYHKMVIRRKYRGFRD